MGTLVFLVAIAVSLLGCSASSRPSAAPAPSPPSAQAVSDGIRRVAVVAYGESRFAAVSPSAQPGRTFDEILKYNPYPWYSAILRPFVGLLHQGINWLLQYDDAKTVGAHVNTVSPRALVAESLIDLLEASGRFEQVHALESEPVGEERRRADAIVRVAVPTWGFVRIRQGDPALVSVFADVQAQARRRTTGVVLWEGQEDVTASERFPLEALTRDPEFARQQLAEVLARAGRRLASEFLYSRSPGP
jgi:hypothetical protein